MEELRKKVRELELVGGRLSLDFANTVDSILSNEPGEELGDYRALLQWSIYAETISEDEAEGLQERAVQQPETVAAIVARSMKLREAIYHILMAVTSGESPSQEALAQMNEELALAMPHVQLVADPDGFHWHWERDGALDAILWPVVEDAADLLTAGSLERVKQCDGHGCDWLFLDTSRNRSRRWCSMETCGNRAKARRFYHRHQDED